MEQAEVCAAVVASIAVAELVEEMATTLPPSAEAEQVQSVSLMLLDHLKRLLSLLRKPA